MAIAAKTKGPASDSIMPPDKMKPLLALSKREPVQAAFGLTGDGEGVLLLDKKMKPKKVMATLKSAAAKAKIQLQPSTVRFGRAEVDTDYDAGTVRFHINKEVPGNMRPRLIEVVRRIPYQKVEFDVDETPEQEPEEDAAEGETARAQPDLEALKKDLAALIGRIPVAAANDAGRKTRLATLAGAANNGLKANNPAAAGAGIAALQAALDELSAAGTAPSADQVRKDLMTLIRRIPAVAGDDAAPRAALMATAGDANTSLKANDLAAAADRVTALREALDQATGAPGGVPQTESGPARQTGSAAPADLTGAWRAARAAWQSANDTVDGQLTVLFTALRASDDEVFRQIAELGPNALTGGFRNRMTAALTDIGEADAPDFRKKAAKAAGFVEKLRTQI